MWKEEKIKKKKRETYGKSERAKRVTVCGGRNENAIASEEAEEAHTEDETNQTTDNRFVWAVFSLNYQAHG